MENASERDEYSDEETARRRDEVIKRMINTSPQPHKPLGKPKPKVSASLKKRGHKAAEELPVRKGRVHKGESRT